MDTDLVARNEVLKAQEILEEKARREWPAKWGFYLNFDKFCLEEATKRGYSEEDYRRMTVKKKSKHNIERDIWPPAPPKPVPILSSGFAGWRSGPNYSLEKFGSLYISPRHTLPYEPPYRCIILG
ncbi:uncharacterized protein C20orf85 homolog [Anoplophora glabripennis]|uniref:uncharacterized protein C20orf85 homolog n=1 Tax=Anoplophora glabripennis TaxID=217634 RepID=UPI000874EF2E|nr:uncharacterized protein C20orf85 homolog [Anoplophora glabripennis]